MATSLRPTLTIQPVGDLSERHISDTVSRKPRGKEKTVSAQTHVFSSLHHGVTTAWPALHRMGSTPTGSVSWGEEILGARGGGGGWEDGLGIQSLPDAHKAFGSAPTSGRWGKEKGKQLRGKIEWVGQVLGSHQAHLRDRISLSLCSSGHPGIW